MQGAAIDRLSLVVLASRKRKRNTPNRMISIFSTCARLRNREKQDHAKQRRDSIYRILVVVVNVIAVAFIARPLSLAASLLSIGWL